MNSNETFLPELEAGTRAIVRRMHGGHEVTSRLSAMGMSVGSEIQVLENPGHGPLLVLVRDTRIALGRGEAMKIAVDRIAGD